MIIPKDPGERLLFVKGMIQRCFVSRQSRESKNNQFRNYYLYGTQDDHGAEFNKIKATIETLSSFLYSPDGVKFSIQLGASADGGSIAQANVMSSAVDDHWRKSNTGLLFGTAAIWSLVYGTMLIKMSWSHKHKAMKSWLVEPHQFGVYREDIIALDDQEAFAHRYSATKSELITRYRGNVKNIEEKVSMLGRQDIEGASPPAAISLIGAMPYPGSFSIQQATGVGGQADMFMGSGWNYEPQVDADTIEMTDLYVWDDLANDYAVFVIGGGVIVFLDRHMKDIAVERTSNFVAVRCSNVLYDYFWGESFVANLIQLQEWRTEITQNIRRLENKQADPAFFVSGVTLPDSKANVLRSKGGVVTAQSPAAKVEPLPPKMPENVYQSLGEVDQMFDSASGIAHVMQGKGETGVRSRAQTDTLARLGSSRPKAQSLVLEDCAQEVASLILSFLQKYSEHKYAYTLPGNDKVFDFLPSQFTDDFEVKVDGHSTSPIYVEDMMALVMQMFEIGAIDRSTVLEMSKLPGLQNLQQKLKILEQKEQIEQQSEARADASKQGKGKG